MPQELTLADCKQGCARNAHIPANGASALQASRLPFVCRLDCLSAPTIPASQRPPATKDGHGETHPRLLLLLSAALQEPQVVLHRQHPQPCPSARPAQWLEQGRREADVGADEAALGDDLHSDRLSIQIRSSTVRMGLAKHSRDSTRRQRCSRRKGRRAAEEIKSRAKQEKEATHVLGGTVEKPALPVGC